MHRHGGDSPITIANGTEMGVSTQSKSTVGWGVKHCTLGEVTLGETVDNAVVWQYGCNGERKCLCLATAYARVIVRSVCICHLYTFVCACARVGSWGVR